MKKVIFFGTYNPQYPRNRLLRRWTQARANMIEINERGMGIGKYLRLVRALMHHRDVDAVIIPFPGHTACIVARLFFHKMIIFDAFISMYDTYVFDRAVVKPGSLRSMYYWCIDWLAFHSATVIVIDTDEHAAYLQREFGVSSDRICVVPVVTDTELFYPRVQRKSAQKIIWWHGKYTRLHNVQYIIEVASLMKGDTDVVFHLLGNGGELATIKASMERRKLTNVMLVPAVPYEELPERIAAADVCLGVFGVSKKIDHVVPNKVYEYLACGKPVVTRHSVSTERICIGLPVRYVGTAPEDAVRAIHELLSMRIDAEQLYARVREWYVEAQERWEALI